MNPILLFHLKCGIDLSVGDEAGYLGKGAGGVRDDARLRGPHHQGGRRRHVSQLK